VKERGQMAVSSSRRTPKYHQVANAIRAQIQSEELRPGDRLPAETAIAEEHKTSVPTVRQAMASLRAEGLIESRHGIGTFVRQEARLERRSRHRYGAARGRDGLLNAAFRHEITSVEAEPAPAPIATAMGIEPGADVVVRRRELYDESDTLQEIGASYLPRDFATGTYLAEPKVVPKALFRCVEEITGRRYATATDSWIARPATPDEADRFGLVLGTYLMHVTHVARDERGAVLEVSVSMWPADRITLVDEYDIPATATDANARSDI
jgi:GntR family transcriptional regulator